VPVLQQGASPAPFLLLGGALFGISPGPADLVPVTPSTIGGWCGGAIDATPGPAGHPQVSVLAPRGSYAYRSASAKQAAYEPTARSMLPRIPARRWPVAIVGVVSHSASRESSDSQDTRGRSPRGPARRLLRVRLPRSARAAPTSTATGRPCPGWRAGPPTLPWSATRACQHRPVRFLPRGAGGEPGSATRAARRPVAG
jgi:hypothetical protein